MLSLTLQRGLVITEALSADFEAVPGLSPYGLGYHALLQEVSPLIDEAEPHVRQVGHLSLVHDVEPEVEAEAVELEKFLQPALMPVGRFWQADRDKNRTEPRRFGSAKTISIIDDRTIIIGNRRVELTDDMVSMFNVFARQEGEPIEQRHLDATVPRAESGVMAALKLHDDLNGMGAGPVIVCQRRRSSKDWPRNTWALNPELQILDSRTREDIGARDLSLLDVSDVLLSDLENAYDRYLFMSQKTLRETFRKQPLGVEACNKLLEIAGLGKAESELKSDGSEVLIERGQYAERVIIASHLHIVYATVSGFVLKSGIQYGDIMQEGCIVLMRAIHAANLPTRTSFNFGGYVTNAVKNRVKDILLKHSSDTAPPLEHGALIAHKRINKVIDAAASKGVVLSDRDVAKETGDNLSDVKYLSSNNPRHELTSWSIVPAEDVPAGHIGNPEDDLEASERAVNLRLAYEITCKSLAEQAMNPLRRQIVEAYFMADEPLSIAEVATMTGCTVPAVKKQIHVIRKKIREDVAEEVRALIDS